MEAFLLKIRASAPDMPSRAPTSELERLQNTESTAARDATQKRPLAKSAPAIRRSKPVLIASSKLVQEPKPMPEMDVLHAKHPLDHAHINLAVTSLADEVYTTPRQDRSASDIVLSPQGILSSMDSFMPPVATPDRRISRSGDLSHFARRCEVVLGIDVPFPVSDEIRDAAISKPVSQDAKRPPPESHGPFYPYSKSVRNLREALSQIMRGRIMRQFSASELQVMAQVSRYSAVVVSRCDLEVLKALVASDFVPVVITRSPVGQKHIRAMIEYDDSAERLTLLDPMHYAKQRFSYSEFSRQWDDPQDACLLIFPHRIASGTIRLSLTRYLPIKRIDSILIKAPRRR
jgi:hypothetical protein